MNTIEQMEDNTLATLLTEYYFNGKIWYEVAIVLGYNYRDTVQRKHPAALRAVSDLLEVEIS